MPGERIVYLLMASLEAVNDFAFSFFLKKTLFFFCWWSFSFVQLYLYKCIISVSSALSDVAAVEGRRAAFTSCFCF